MGLIKFYKGLRAVNAENAARPRPGSSTPKKAGGMAAFVGAMVKMIGPTLVAQAPDRGGPLPATSGDVLTPAGPEVIGAGVAAIQARDSAFDQEVFTAFAGQVFAAYGSMWGTGDTAAMRPLLADVLWDQLAGALASGFAAGPANIYSRLRGTPTPAGAWAEGWYDSVLVSYAVDVDIPHDGGDLPDGVLATEWTEDWLFQRSVVPGGDPMVIVDRCPDCGATRQADGLGRCGHCQRPLPVSTSGWLVTAIRCHNPTVLAFRQQIVDQLRDQPEMMAMLPDDLVRLLPAADVAAIDPERAATLDRPAT